MAIPPQMVAVRAARSAALLSLTTAHQFWRGVWMLPVAVTLAWSETKPAAV